MGGHVLLRFPADRAIGQTPGHRPARTGRTGIVTLHPHADGSTLGVGRDLQFIPRTDNLASDNCPLLTRLLQLITGKTVGPKRRQAQVGVTPALVNPVGTAVIDRSPMT